MQGQRCEHEHSPLLLGSTGQERQDTATILFRLSFIEGRIVGAPQWAATVGGDGGRRHQHSMQDCATRTTARTFQPLQSQCHACELALERRDLPTVHQRVLGEDGVRDPEKAHDPARAVEEYHRERPRSAVHVLVVVAEVEPVQRLLPA